MSKQVTVAGDNRYCQARLAAAKYNTDFFNRRTAAEHLPGVSEDSLKKYELGINNPPNSVVALMADAYNSPELLSWYCANECPLGTRCREQETAPAERIFIRLQNEIPNLHKDMKALACIMDDGKLKEDEKSTAIEIKNNFLEIYRRLNDILTVLDKATKTGVFE
jgi:hypothetical protein